MHKPIKEILKIAILSTIIGFVFHLYLYFSETGEFPDYFSDILLSFNVFVLANISGSFVYYANKAINGLTFLTDKNNLKFIISIAVNYLILIVLWMSAFVIYFKWFSNETTPEIFAKYNELFFRVFVLGFVLIFLFVIIDFSIRSYQKFLQVKLNALQSAREQADLQLEAFKSQLSPHYLFNNLNTISLLVYKDPKLSEEYIRKLSQTYDYIIETNKKNLVPLSEEIEFIKAYKYLLNIRFKDDLQVNINILDTRHDLFLLPLSLQILIENAVKHNAPSGDRKLIVNIEQRGKYVQVKNNLLHKPAKTDSFKIGLNNIKKRYKFHTNKKVIIKHDSEFIVKIPLLKN